MKQKSTKTERGDTSNKLRMGITLMKLDTFSSLGAPEGMSQSFETTRYSEAFCTDEAVRRYEDLVYQPGAYSEFIWTLQRKKLLEIVKAARQHRASFRHLDFACGTGRILSALEGLTTASTGVDISPNMAAVAVQKATQSSIVVGDILQNPNLIEGSFDLITAFRFFLNAESDLRIRLMTALAKRLRDSNSLFIFNIHGNRTSLRHLAICYRAVRGGPRHPELTLREVCDLIRYAGLRIESWCGLGICPELMHRGKLRGVARLIDQLCLSMPFMKWVSYDLLFVCKPASGSVYPAAV
jgi:SAM-dependent methyltransferase